MRIRSITGESSAYSSNVYLITASTPDGGGANTLIDVGRDPLVFARLRDEAREHPELARIDQVILTHDHYDHTGMLGQVVEMYHPIVCGYSTTTPYVTHPVRDGDILPAGDGELRVLYTPGHTHDSISLYAESEGALFVGDLPLNRASQAALYDEGYARAILALSRLTVRAIYFGHGDPARARADLLLSRAARAIAASPAGELASPRFTP